MSKENLLTKGVALAGHMEWAGAEITVGALTGGDTINVSIQLLNGLGQERSERTAVFAYLSDDANGDSVAATAPNGNVAIGSDGVLIPIVADKAFMLISEADGDIDLDIVDSGSDTWYLILQNPNGDLIASDAITIT